MYSAGSVSRAGSGPGAVVMERPSWTLARREGAPGPAMRHGRLSGVPGRGPSPCTSSVSRRSREPRGRWPRPRSGRARRRRAVRAARPRRGRRGRWGARGRGRGRWPRARAAARQALAGRQVDAEGVAVAHDPVRPRTVRRTAAGPQQGRRQARRPGSSLGSGPSRGGAPPVGGAARSRAPAPVPVSPWADVAGARLQHLADLGRRQPGPRGDHARRGAGPTAAAIEVPVRGTSAGDAPGAVDRTASPGAARAIWGPRADTLSGRPAVLSAPTSSTWR